MSPRIARIDAGETLFNRLLTLQTEEKSHIELIQKRASPAERMALVVDDFHAHRSTSVQSHAYEFRYPMASSSSVDPVQHLAVRRCSTGIHSYFIKTRKWSGSPN
jgi:hypothetical protein